jgi:N-acetylmuramoyl-L-alanine amidase
LIQQEIVARTDLVDGRTHPKTWELLRLTRMPAVRLHAGYLSNPGDAARLGSAGFRDAIAESVATALQQLYLPEHIDLPTGVVRMPVMSA